MTRRMLMIVLTLALLFAGAQTLTAGSLPGTASDPLATADLQGYKFDFISAADNGDGSSIWTYAVTADGDEARALSHWSVEVQLCHNPILAPADGALYTTLANTAPECTGYNCEQSTCRAVHGTDPTTGVTGIKFEDCTVPLDRSRSPRTHMFQVVTTGAVGSGGPVAISTKAGLDTAVGVLRGPACIPTAVSVHGFSASRTTEPGLLFPAGLGILGTVVLAFTVGSRRKATSLE